MDSYTIRVLRLSGSRSNHSPFSSHSGFLHIVTRNGFMNVYNKGIEKMCCGCCAAALRSRPTAASCVGNQAARGAIIAVLVIPSAFKLHGGDSYTSFTIREG